MPKTTVYIYADEHGRSPVLDWFRGVETGDHPRFGRLHRSREVARIDGARAPQAVCVNYRLLFFFHGKDIAVVAHGLTKEQAVPAREIERAIERRQRYEQYPQGHRATLDI